MKLNNIYLGDALEVLSAFPSHSVDCVVTSPPYYGMRDYGMSGQIGQEGTPDEYVNKLILVFEEVKRLLKNSGTVWINLGDCYGPGKGLIGIPWMFALAMKGRGWILRNEIIWNKSNPTPESIKDRLTKSHEYIFFFVKTKKYYFDYEVIMEKAISQNDRRKGKREEYNGKFDGRDGRTKAFVSIPVKKDKSGNVIAVRRKRDVWTVACSNVGERHYAIYPPALIEPCILAGCPMGGVVLDPFMGSGTTGIVARRFNRNYVGVEINPEFKELAERRIHGEDNLFNLTNGEDRTI